MNHGGINSVAGPAVSVGGAVYAVITETWYVGVATLIATVAGVLINALKVWRESKNVEMTARLDAAAKEIDDLKKSHDNAVKSILISHEESFEKLSNRFENDFKHSLETIKKHVEDIKKDIEDHEISGQN